MLTERDRQVLDWLTLEGADAWFAHAVKEFGEEAASVMLDQKVARWWPAYNAAADKRPRAERESGNARK